MRTTLNPAPFYFFFRYDEDEGVFVPTGIQNVGNEEGEDLVETLDGNDLLRGFGGNDTLDGGAGNDTLDGGAGDDVFRIAPGDGSDTITDFNADTDRLEFTDGLFANLEAVQASAAEVGDDLLIRLSFTETLTLEGASKDDLSTDTVTTVDILGEDTTLNPAPFYFFFRYDEDEGVFVPTGIQNVGNEEGEDLVETLDGNDLLRGFGGNDTLDGGAGNDTLDGGAGDDVFRIAPGDGSDTITDFNADTDRLEFTDGLFANLEAVQASAAAVGDDLLIRLSATETLTLAGASEDALSTDTVTTLNAEGADTTTNPAPFYFFFEYDEDTGAFVPTGTQNAGSDEAEDLVETLDGNDLLRGFGGNDTLDGGAGNDTLDGGAGDDVFRIAPGDGSDTITDFNADTDRLEFTDGLFANLEAVQASAAAVGDDLLIRLSFTETLTLEGASKDDLSTDTVTTLNAEGADTTTNPAPFYFFFEYDEDTGVFVPTGIQNVGNEEGEDLVETLDGNDLLRGFGGNDTLDGGAGNDTLDGGAGDDVFRIAPGDGSDTITDFNADTDRLEFTDGLFANLEAVQASAAAVGDDLLIRLSATETLTLESTTLAALTTDTVTILDADVSPPDSGNQNVDVDSGAQQGGGAEPVDTGGTGSGTVTPPPSVRTIVGTSGNDVLTGSAGEDFLRGLAGNDQLTGGAGGDRLFGGAGRDNALYRDSGVGVMVDLESGTASGGDAAGDTLVAIEDLTGSAFDDTLSGNAQANGLSGGSGDDRLNGAGGADLLLGGLGNDVLDGGSGRDALSGDEGDDTLEGGAGVDELLGGPGNDVLRGGDDTDRLFGGAGNTMLSGDGGADVLYGGVGDDTLSGGEGADVLNGLSGSNVLTGGAGSDVFVFFGDRAETRVTDFNPSEDRLSVLAGDAEGLTTGNDESGHLVIEVGETRATLEGVSAIDEISIDYRLESPLQDAAEVNERVDEDGNLVLEVVDTSVVLEGLSSLAGITIGYQQGDADHEVLVGSAGHDVLYGGGGNDVLSGGLSGDLVIGGSGHDVVYGGAAGDLLLGESGDDLLFGEGGADVIRGGAGSDILVGGDGDNVLQGGAGEDMFVVDVGAVGNERIVDFNLLEDSLVFLGLEPADRGLEGTAVDGGTLLTLSDEHTLLVVGVNPEDLGRMDVVFF